MADPAPRRGPDGGPDCGAYPGSFNPVTTAHLEVASAARRAHDLAEVHLIVSQVALGKEGTAMPLLRHRLEVLEAVVATRSWLRLVVTEAQLIADIAEGYGVVIMGADKWEQIHDERFYDSVRARDEAIARLPTPAIAPRPPHRAPSESLLDLPEHVAVVSSSRARGGRLGLMAPEAAAFDRRTGAWTDPERYRAWVDRR
jgi:hypothetical protein